MQKLQHLFWLLCKFVALLFGKNSVPTLTSMKFMPIGIRAKAIAGVEDAITLYGDKIVGVFSAWDGGALSAVSALDVAGLSDNVVVCGFDGTPTSMTYIREGKLQAELGQPLYELGKVGMETVNTVLTGGQVDEEQLLTCSIVTSDNVEDFIKSAGLADFIS